VQVDSSDRPVLGGERQLLSQPPKSVVFRSTVDGDLDTGFGENGFAFPITGPSSTFTNDLAVDGQGRIVVAGSGSAEPGLTAARLLGDGSIDLSFSGDGHQSVVFDGNPLLQRAVAVELDAEDRIVLFGYAPTAELDPNDDLIQARLLDNGNLDPAFGQGGRNRILTDTSDEGVGASAIDAAGRLVIGGSFSNASTDGKEGLVARVGDSGLFDQGFGQAGFIRQDWNQPRAEVYGLTIDAEGRYLVASDLTLADDTRQIGLARYTVDYPKEPDPPDPPQKPVVKCSGKAATITGSTKKDRLKGTRKRDVIQGLGGNDVIKGLKGNDLICGGKGNDKLIGGPGKDVLRGDAGKDKLFGGPAKDRLIGGKGRDRCLKGPGKGRLSGCERRR